MQAVINGSEENKDFWKWTPSGALSLQTINGEAAKRLVVGEEYFLDITQSADGAFAGQGDSILND